MTDDVVVTGLGATTPLGGNVATTWAGLLAGRSGVVALTDSWAADLSVRIAARMAVDPAAMMSEAHAQLGRSEQAAIIAAREAWRDAGFEGTAREAGLDPTRVAVVIGTGSGGVSWLLADYDVLLDKGACAVSRLPLPLNAPAVRVGIEIGAQAGAHTTSSACASGSEAVALGLDLLQLDRADIVLVGGAEACIHPVVITGFAQMRAMSTRNDEPQRASRPWDKRRDGFVLGEGAGALVLERASSGVARGQRAYATLAASGITSDSYDIVQPDTAGQVRALKLALRRSGLCSADIVHVNAHATSTPAGDIGESDGIADLLGTDTVVTAIKSMTGHLLGAAGAIESVATVLAVYNDVVPPTINLEDPDDNLKIDVPRIARKMSVTAAMNNSFGFGGHNVSLVFRKA